MRKNLCILLMAGGSFSAWSSECGTLIDQMEDIGALKTVLRCLDDQLDSRPKAAIKGAVRGFQKADIQAKLKQVGYEFEVEHCLRSGKGLKCSVIITNKNKSQLNPGYKEFGIYTSATHFFDEFGGEYTATQTQIGNTLVQFDSPSNMKRQPDGYLSKYMPLLIPMKTTITFSTIDAKTTTVLALNIKFSYRDRSGNLADKYVTLKGIAVGASN